MTHAQLAIVILIALAAVTLGASSRNDTVPHEEIGRFQMMSVEEHGGIDALPFILNILLTGGTGLVFDFIHGTVYRPLPSYEGPGADRT